MFLSGFYRKSKAQVHEKQEKWPDNWANMTYKWPICDLEKEKLAKNRGHRVYLAVRKWILLIVFSNINSYRWDSGLVWLPNGLRKGLFDLEKRFCCWDFCCWKKESRVFVYFLFDLAVVLVYFFLYDGLRCRLCFFFSLFNFFLSFFRTFTFRFVYVVLSFFKKKESIQRKKLVC